MKTSSIPGLPQTAYAWLVRGASTLQSPFLLLVRLYWGWSFFGTGKGKLMSHAQVTDYFASLNIPLPSLNAWMAGTTECVGGLLLIIGLLSRLTTLPLIITLTVAYLTAEQDSLKQIFSDPDKFTAATPFLFLLAMLIILIFGPGRFSLDGLLARKWGGKPD